MKRETLLWVVEVNDGGRWRALGWTAHTTRRDAQAELIACVTERLTEDFRIAKYVRLEPKAKGGKR